MTIALISEVSSQIIRKDGCAIAVIVSHLHGDHFGGSSFLVLVIAYLGDTEWTDVLLEVARGADLFVCEAYFYDKRVRNHLSYTTLRQHLQRLE